MEKIAPPYAYARAKPTTTEDIQDSVGIYPYLHILRNRKWTLLFCVFSALGVAFFVNLTQKAVYQASAQLILQPRESKAATPGPPTANLVQDPTFLFTQDRLIHSPRLAQRVLEKLEAAENREPLLANFGVHPSRKRKDPSIFSEKERRALTNAIQGSVSLRQIERGARILMLSVTGYVPSMVAQLANVAAESYVEINYKARMESFRQNFSMVSRTLAEIREKIKTGELASQKINSEIRLMEALKIYEDKHPLVIQLREEIPALIRKLMQGTKNLESMEISQRKDLVSLLMKPSTTLEDLQKIEEDLYTLKPILEQEVSSNREMYNSIFRRLQEIELSGGSGLWMDAEVVEPASIPGKPIRPNKQLNLILGLLLGLLFGVTLTFFQEYLDSSIRSLEDVRNYLKIFPLGMVPQIELAPREGDPAAENLAVEISSEESSAEDQTERRYWLANDSKIPLYVAEAYRIIRTNLAFGSVDTSLKVLQVTSAVKGEGKTTTAANLAISFALGGSQVLLVDADLRRPSIHRILHLEGTLSGLSDALTNGKSWESAIVPTSVPNLSCLVAGVIPPNPAELLSSKRMKVFIDEIKERFEMVIFDSPPVISVADSAIIASRVDGTIFVSRSGFIPRHLCLQAKSALESVNGKVIGCVLNGVQSEQQPYYSHQYSQEYGRYQEEGTPWKSKRRLSATLEELSALREPLLLFLSTTWRRLGVLLKSEKSRKESKSSVDAL